MRAFLLPLIVALTIISYDNKNNLLSTVHGFSSSQATTFKLYMEPLKLTTTISNSAFYLHSSWLPLSLPVVSEYRWPLPMQDVFYLDSSTVISRAEN